MSPAFREHFRGVLRLQNVLTLAQRRFLGVELGVWMFLQLPPLLMSPRLIFTQTNRFQVLFVS